MSIDDIYEYMDEKASIHQLKLIMKLCDNRLCDKYGMHQKQITCPEDITERLSWLKFEETEKNSNRNPRFMQPHHQHAHNNKRTRQLHAIPPKRRFHQGNQRHGGKRGIHPQPSQAAQQKNRPKT